VKTVKWGQSAGNRKGASETERETSFEMMIQSDLHGDMQKPAEMPGSLSVHFDIFRLKI
jgi:hypothetical protein